MPILIPVRGLFLSVLLIGLSVNLFAVTVDLTKPDAKSEYKRKQPMEDFEVIDDVLMNELEAEDGFTIDTSIGGEDDILEELRFNPVDLNSASVEKLRELPEVDYRIAENIISYRKRKNGFSSVSELREVPGVSGVLYRTIRPYIQVLPIGVPPVRFSGDTRFRLRAIFPGGSTYMGADDEYKNLHYVYNRTRMRFGDSSQVGWLLKRGSVGLSVTPENMRRYYFRKFSIQENAFPGLSRCIFGNYTLSYGQGLLFYDNLAEFIRPMKVKARGGRPDFTTGDNSYLRGIFTESRLGNYTLAFFTSEKDLDLRVDDNGYVTGDMYALRESLGAFQADEDLENNDTVRERLYGGRVEYNFIDNSKVGVTGYDSWFSKTFNPTETAYNKSHAFRGNKNTVMGADLDLYYMYLNLYGEVARSKSRGGGVGYVEEATAWTMSPMFKVGRVIFWTTFFDYDEDFFSRHAKAVSASVVGVPNSLPDNQKGLLYGMEYKGKKHKPRLNYKIVSFPMSQGSGDSNDTILPAHVRKLYYEHTYKATKKLDLYFRVRRDEEEVFYKGEGVSERVQQIKIVSKYRYQITWQPVKTVKYRVRYQTRHERYENSEIGYFGHYIMGGLRYMPTDSMTLYSRIYYFDSPKAYLTTGVSPLWNRVVYYRLGGAMQNLVGTPGTRFYFIVKQKFKKSLELWMMYDCNYKPEALNTSETNLNDREDDVFGASKHGFHVQIDYRWGLRKLKEPEQHTIKYKDWKQEVE